METYTKDGVLFLAPKTDLVADKFDELRDFFLEELSKSDEKEVVLDAEGVEVVDSLGVNLIIGLYKELDSSGRSFKIINAAEKFIKVAHFFKFPALFDIEGVETDK